MAYKISHSVGDIARARANQSWISVLVLSVTLPVVVGALTALTAPSARRDLLRRAAKSFGAMVPLIAGVFVFPASVLTGFVDGKFATNPVMSVVTWVVTACKLTRAWQGGARSPSGCTRNGGQARRSASNA
ncbi:hypothetical protein [Streptomyces sp. NPDC050164]|uniref:hypothetical protein n=1 Tax=Streptomyces sp. NPDC050164 TaxID=3365605 RepID=UPI00379780D1